jgi:hypothetical protein
VQEILRADDLIVTVCDRAHEELEAAVSQLHWSVTDPARRGDDSAFDQALVDLATRVARFAPAVRTAG